MINNSIFEQVKRLADSTFGGSDKTVLDIIYGYARLISMDKNVLNVLFAEESEQKDLADISDIIEKNNIDVELLKQAAPFFHLNGTKVEDVKELKSVLDKMTDNDDEYSASQILEKLFEVNIPEIEIVKKGHTLEDVISYFSDDKADSLDKKDNIRNDNDIEDNKNESEERATLAKEIAELLKEICEMDPELKSKLSPDFSTKEDEKEKIDNTFIEEPMSVEPEKENMNNNIFKMLIKRTTQLYDRLRCHVVGQDEAIRLFAEGYFQSEVFQDVEKNRKKPSATFLFAGPPGVGKTFLASTAADILGLPFLRIDMSEYGQTDSVKRLSGIPKTFASPKPGRLTKFVKDNPRSIILLDEIEKACDEVIYLFLQVLDGGVLTDEFMSESISFKDTILIFTTNVGKKLYENRDRMNLSSLPRSIVMKEIEEEKDEYGDNVFPAAICSRFASGNIIMFNHLSVHNLISIVNAKYKESVEMIKEGYGFETIIDKRLASMLVYSQSTNMDARNMSSQAELLIKNELYEFGRHIISDSDRLDNIEDIEFKLKYSEDSDVALLFYNSDISNVLYVGNEDDIKDVPISPLCNIFLGNKDNAMEIISKNDVDFTLISVEQIEDESQYLSLDDNKSDGVKAFDIISDKLPQMPIYIIHKSPISNEDKTNFLERGAREFVEFEDNVLFADKISEISEIVYMQKKVNELSGRGRILKYNSAQRIVDDGKKAEIIFYDFKTAIASDADENKLLLSDDSRPKEKFEDVIGAEDAKSELKYFVDYLKNPKKFMVRSIKLPKGILLYGPPGTGKTMLARAMAGESDVTFFPATATGFMNKYVGESESNIKNLFKTAKKFAPSIIFIDEIDAIGKERIGSESTHHTETMLNALLTEMDGFEVDESKPVFVVAATNYDIDGSQSGKRTSLDGALLRRFDNKIYVDLPKESERNEYIKLQLSKINKQRVTDEVINNISERTTGVSIAILKNILDLAVRNSNKKDIDLDNNVLLEAFEEYMYGEKKDWDEDYYKSVSIHESGHAYICYLSGENPSFVTIVSRGDFGGYMQHANSEKIPSYTKEQLLWKIRVALAGRAAELEFFGDKGINTGVSSDLRNATRIALDIICTYAMSDDGILSISPESVIGSQCGDNLIEKANEILKNEMEITKKLIHEGRDKVSALAEYLQKNNQATEKEIIDIFE